MVRCSRAALLGSLFLVFACAKKPVVKQDPALQATGGAVPASAAGAVGAVDASAPLVDVAEAAIRGKEFAAAAELKTVSFDYDAYALGEAARAGLQQNADYLKAHPDLEILVAGHCDERGTVQYNLALGQRRAKAVRDYYIRLGVAGRSVATISYGKEKPLCQEATEDCWLQNRRGETRVRARVASNDHSADPTQTPK